MRNFIDAVSKINENAEAFEHLETQVQQKLDEIGCALFGVRTLETQNSDSLDFHDIPVWNIREALARAYSMGQQARGSFLTKENIIDSGS